MNVQLADTISLIISEFKNITGQVCYFLPKADSDNVNSKLKGDNCTAACREITKEKDKRSYCEQKRQKVINYAVSRRESKFFICSFGLYEIIVPVCSGTSLEGVLCAIFKPESLVNIVCEQQKSQTDRSDQVLSNSLKDITPLDGDLITTVMSLLSNLVTFHTKQIQLIDPAQTVAANSDKNAALDQVTLRTWGEWEGKSLSQRFECYQLNHQSFHTINKQFEHSFNMIYLFILSQHLDKARGLFWTIFMTALQEKDIKKQRLSALYLISKCSDAFMYNTSNTSKIYKLVIDTTDNIYLSQNADAIRTILDAYFDELVSTCWFSVTAKNPVVNRIIQYIYDHYAEAFSIDDMMKEMNISASYAGKIFADTMGMSIKWYINEIRMFHAQNYIKTTNLPISDIANKVGYTNVRSFYKMYSKHFDIPCSKLREL